MGLLHGLDDDAEGGIAINLLPLVAQKYTKRTALSAYTESGVSDPLCISPSVRLLRVCEEKQCGNLENIDALLGRYFKSKRERTSIKYYSLKIHPREPHS